MIKGGMVSLWQKWNYFRKRLMMILLVVLMVLVVLVMELESWK